MNFDDNWSAAGDTPNDSQFRRTLTSGCRSRVPVFRPVDKNANEIHDEEDCVSFRSWNDIPDSKGKRGRSKSTAAAEAEELNPKKYWKDMLKTYMSCPICKELFIETTSTNCGHKFCKGCIQNWRKTKAVCPMCSTYISSVQRLYSDDQFIESQLDNFSSDVKKRFKLAEKQRVEELIRETSSKSLTKNVRRSLNNSLTYLRSCSSREIAGNWWTSLRAWADSNYKIFTTFLWAVLAFYLVKTLLDVYYYLAEYDFVYFKYMWAASKRYNGTIPKDWTSDSVEGNATDLEKKSISETIVGFFLFKNYFGPNK